MEYTIVLEAGDSGFGAFVPDLPVCIAVGETKEETLILIQDAIQFHIEGLKEAGEPVAVPRCDFVQVEVGE